jgi:THAP domain
MPGSCAVVGCPNRFIKGGKHFYKFPKNEQYRQLWIQFTRRGNNFSVTKCSSICEEHFAPDRIIMKKKGRMYLLKNTVPIIYYRRIKQGIEKVFVEFDSQSGQYIGQESVNLLKESTSEEQEKKLILERESKIKELKSLCRFCFESQDEKFVAISKLEAYSITPDEMLSLIGIGPQFNEIFSEIVCEQCFQQIVSIDGYRKRCCKAQEEIIAEMEEFDQEIHNFQSLMIEEIPWYKEEGEEETHNAALEITEEHLEESYVCEEEDGDYDAESTYEGQEFVVYKTEDELIEESRTEDDSKISHPDEFIVEQGFEMKVKQDDQVEDDEEDDEEFMDLADPINKDIYNTTDPDAIITNRDRNTFALRVYECFFCRLVRNILDVWCFDVLLNFIFSQKFAGKKTYKAHECQVKEVKCEVDGCDKLFNKLSGYNTHVVKVHSLLKTSKNFCPICKNVIMATENQFKLHRRKCVKDSEKNDSETPIECEICKKLCPNLKSYTVHKLFHDSKKLIGNERGGLNLSKGPLICEVS